METLTEADKLLQRALEFIGAETSLERQTPRVVSTTHTTPTSVEYQVFSGGSMYSTKFPFLPVSQGEQLRQEAARADRQDELILAIRKHLITKSE